MGSEMCIRDRYIMGASQSQCINAKKELDKLEEKKKDLEKQIGEKCKENQESEKIQESEQIQESEKSQESKKGEKDSNGGLTGGKKRKRTKKDRKKHMKKTGKKHMKKTGKKHMKKTGKK